MNAGVDSQHVEPHGDCSRDQRCRQAGQDCQAARQRHGRVVNFPVARVIDQCGEAGIDSAIEDYLNARVDPYQRLATLMGSTSGSQADDASAVMVMVHQIRQVVA